MISQVFLPSLILFSSLICISGFSRNAQCNGPISTRLNGIAEWRDFPSGINFDGDNHDEAYDILNYGESARRVPVLCVKPEQAVLQGEKKYFQFHSKDELRLFQQALDLNHGIFALGIIISDDDDEDDVVMSKLQLMEIKDYNMNLGVDFGIFCASQAVGRAKLLSLLGSNQNYDEETGSVKDSMVAICEEHFDIQETYYSIEEANEMARSVLDVLSKLSAKEQDLDNEHDVKILYDINNDEDEDFHDFKETRVDRFGSAGLASLESDSYGYISNAPIGEGMLSWKEMNAISWAAFSSASSPSDDETMRLYAFDCDRITDRLKLASFWLADVFEEVEQESNSR